MSAAVWRDDIEYVEISAAGLAVMGWALLTAATDVAEFDESAGAATRAAGRSVLTLSRAVQRLGQSLDEALHAYTSGTQADRRQ